MNIEYEFTVEDDLDARYTNWILWLKKGKLLFFPARYFPLLILVMSIAFIVWGLLTQVKEDQYLLIGSGIFLFFVGILLFYLYKPKNFLSSLSRKGLEKEYYKYFASKEQRNLCLTAEKFIFKTNYSEMAWNWKAFKSYEEEKKGFNFSFYSGHKIFIPKKAFASKEQLNDFRHLIEQHKSNN